MSAGDGYVRRLGRVEDVRPDGTVVTYTSLAVWTLAHRGYSGNGRLDVWVYRTQAEALSAGAELAMEAGLDEDPDAVELYARGRHAQVLQRYEQTRPVWHVLRVQRAFLQD